MTNHRELSTEIDEDELTQTEQETWAAGVPAVAVSLSRAVEQMGVAKTTRTFLTLNQRDGFDCPGCAWPETPGARKIAEFCENGAKAVIDEGTKHRVGPEFFAQHSVAELREHTEWWLNKQGRLTHPVVVRPGGTHYEPISWDDAHALVAEHLQALGSPDEAVFYTSGKITNEPAFVLGALARSLGTNNLPDCSNMCHESSGVALSEAIGVGKGTASVTDIVGADLVLIVGQNPGTNHPRMLSVLEAAKDEGATIVAVNPLKEAGLRRFKDPQKVKGVIGRGTTLADELLQIRLGGDMALFRALGRLVLEAEDAAPGTVLDHAFITSSTAGFAEWSAAARAVDLDEVVEATGLELADIRRVGALLARSRRTVACWAMGLTQHTQGVATIQELTNLMLALGMVGKPGAGLCPVRGHSNVQGDRTMGIWEQMPDAFLDDLDAELGITSPREHGLDTVDTIRAMRDGRVGVFVGVGGNFVAAGPDTPVIAEGMRRCALTVQLSTKLNRSHLEHGATGLVLPVISRTERDVQASGHQVLSVEDSMSMVHLSHGREKPASEHLRSDVTILCRIALATLGEDHSVPWRRWEADYDTIRDSVSRVVGGFEDFNTRVRQPDGFLLPNPPRDSRSFEGTHNGKANFVTNPLTWVRVPPGRLVLQTLRSHDQFNTTIYGLHDRYRGISDARRVVMVNAQDLAELGLADGAAVDVVSEWTTADGTVEERRVQDFRVVTYDTPRGNAAAYYPETNPLMALDSVALRSGTPVAKAVVVRLEPVTR